jgi:adenylate cyclase
MQKKRLISLIIPLFLSIGFFILKSSNVIDLIELKSLDLRQQKKPISPSDPDTLILLLDEATLEAMEPVAGRWPWKRELWGELTEFLAQSGAKFIIYDFLFTELESPRDDSGNLNPSDQKFAEATAMAGNVVHAFQMYEDIEDEKNKGLLHRPLPQDFLEQHSRKIDHLKQKNNIFYLPINELYQNSIATGFVEFEPDFDGVYRRAQLIREYQGVHFPSLALTPFWGKSKISKHETTFKLDSLNIPVESNGDYLINIKNKFETLSLSGVFQTLIKIKKGESDQFLFDPNQVKNKTIFIGASAAALQDLKTTSVESRSPGVYLHASILDNILKNEFIHKVKEIHPLWIVIVINILISYFIFYHSVYLQLIFSILPLSLYLYSSFYFFNKQLLLIPLAYPLLSMLSNILTGFIYMTFTEGAEKRKVRKMLGQYVSPAVLKEVMDKKQNLTAEVGKKENLTILFSDVRGFTTFSEGNSSEQVVEMLNYYLDKMVDLVFQNNGTLDKFIGDAVMAFYGAPIRDVNHAESAVKTCLQMKKALIEVNDYFKSKNWPEFEIGIGLNTGDVILGNIGSSKKLDYTVIGDNVNLASRMEGLTKPYHCKILISQSTFDQLNGTYPCRIIDLVRVKGKLRPIAIYEPLEIALAQEAALIYQQAFEHYLKQEWSEAMNLYCKWAQFFEEDEYSTMMIERCEEFIKNSPGAEWDGVFVMTSK